jgi:hypothetical protein
MLACSRTGKLNEDDLLVLQGAHIYTCKISAMDIAIVVLTGVLTSEVNSPNRRLECRENSQ